MKRKKKYKAPKMTVIEVTIEPFMVQSGTDRFSNKSGIEQGNKTGATHSSPSFWNKPLDNGQ